MFPLERLTSGYESMNSWAMKMNRRGMLGKRGGTREANTISISVPAPAKQGHASFTVWETCYRVAENKWLLLQLVTSYVLKRAE